MGTTPEAASPLASVKGMVTTTIPAKGGALPRPRIIMDKKERRVRVEVRRAREAGQLEMFGQP